MKTKIYHEPSIKKIIGVTIFSIQGSHLKGGGGLTYIHTDRQTEREILRSSTVNV